MKVLKNASAIGITFLLMGSVTMAQETEAAKACASDIKTLCAGTQPGEGRVKACIKANFNKLSEPCQAVLHKAAAIGDACKADVKQLCASIQPGGGRIEACVKSHMAELSEPCKEALSEAMAGKS
jgi:hypothetical protein